MDYTTLIEPDAPVVEIDPKTIKRGWRAREDYGDIDGLAQSIKADGQMQPILVRKSKKSETPIVIAGMRRLRACRKLNIPVKAVVVEPKDEVHALRLQLGENVRRKQFDVLELGEGLQRLKVVYEKANPETSHGGTGRGRKKRDDAPPKFVDVACDMLDMKTSRIYELLGFADLPAEMKEEISNTKTTKERNTIVQRALKILRMERKKDALRRAAERKEEKRTKGTNGSNGASRQRLHVVEQADPQDPTVVDEPSQEEPSQEEAHDEPVCEARILHGTYKRMLKKLEESSFDLILTDPPYELKRSMIPHMKRKGINDPKEADWDKLDVGWFRDAEPLVEDHGQAIIFCPFEAIIDYRMILSVCGWKFRSTLIWHKTNPGTIHRDTYLSSCEAIIWATKGKNCHFEPWDNAGSREVHNFREGPICGGNERLDHPAQKPLWLITDLLLRHSAQGDNILDPFAGVGTTLVACSMHGRNSVGIEKSKEFVEATQLRLGAL